MLKIERIPTRAATVLDVEVRCHRMRLRVPLRLRMRRGLKNRIAIVRLRLEERYKN